MHQASLSLLSPHGCAWALDLFFHSCLLHVGSGDLTSSWQTEVNQELYPVSYLTAQDRYFYNLTIIEW